MRRVRHGSPEGKLSRVKAKQDDEQDFVNRQPDGNYLLGVSGFGESVAVPQMSVPKTEEELDQDGMLESHRFMRVLSTDTVDCRSRQTLCLNITPILCLRRFDRWSK